ncbi:MAG: hypothetical protein HFF46_06185 [Lawsonibacter sp.]|nr:hypothetical protein [Lawsonibacter sp.]
MPTNRTDNYALSQWERSDRILMEDFNADNAKIDAALRGLEERVSLLYRAVPNLAFYLGQLAITDLSRHRKNMPQRSMLYEDFSIPEFSTLSGSAQIKDGVLQVVGAGQTGRMQSLNISIGYKERAQAKLWLHRHEDSPRVTPLLNESEMKYTGSFHGSSASGGGNGWIDEFTLDCQSITSAQVTLPMDCGKREFVKIHDYALFFF